MAKPKACHPSIKCPTQWQHPRIHFGLPADLAASSHLLATVRTSGGEAFQSQGTSEQNWSLVPTFSFHRGACTPFQPINQPIVHYMPD